MAHMKAYSIWMKNLTPICEKGHLCQKSLKKVDVSSVSLMLREKLQPAIISNDMSHFIASTQWGQPLLLDAVRPHILPGAIYGVPKRL